MDDLRELDARCAELISGEIMAGMVTWGNIWNPEREVFEPYFKPIPQYSSDPAACAELDGEARQEGFTLYLWYDRHGVWVACYLREDEQPNWLNWEFGDTEWEARVKAFIAAKERTDRAVVRALEGSGEK